MIILDLAESKMRVIEYHLKVSGNESRVAESSNAFNTVDPRYKHPLLCAYPR